MAVPITRIRAGALALAAALVLSLAGAAAARASVIQPALFPAQLNPDNPIPWGIPGPDALRTDAVTSCSTGPSAGALDMFAFLNHWWPRGENDGIFNCRTIGTTTGLSLHAQGRAVDFHLNAANAADKAAGVAIRKWFLADDAAGGHYAMARRFGVQELIWNKHIWTSARATEGWRDYAVPAGGDAHTTHVHVGLTKRAANQNTSAWTGFQSCMPGQGGCPPL